MPSFSSPIRITRRAIDLLCVGELLVDMIAASYGDLTECREFQRFAGGSPANIASNVRKLGFTAGLVAAVGADAFGDFLIKSVREVGLDSSLIQRRSDESTSLVVINRTTASPTPIFYRNSDFKITVTPDLMEKVLDSSILHLSCWPLSAEPARSSAKAMIAAAHGRGAMVCLDPNYHPAIWGDRREAQELLELTMPFVDIAKPSEDDANRLFGFDDPERHLRRFLGMGAKVVVMTLGKDGAIASDGEETREYSSLARDIVDVTGAGDAFWSGLYSGMLGGRSLDESIRVGLAVCAIKLRTVGPSLPLVTSSDIDKELLPSGVGVD
jgi:sugar/nucleoside kinase (ribokinase family)